MSKFFKISIVVTLLISALITIDFTKIKADKVTVSNFALALDKCKTFPAPGEEGFELEVSITIENCFNGKLELIEDPAEQLALLVKYSEEPYYSHMCHSLTHNLGASAYKKHQDAAMLLALPNSDFCHNGYYHGVLAEMGDEISYPKLIEVGTATCLPLKKIFYEYVGCVHGMGHASYWAAEKDIYKASDFCGKFNSTYDKIQCRQGVIMQYGKENILKVKNLPIQPSLFTTFCNSSTMLAHDLQRACLNVGIGRLDTEKDMEVMVDYCNSLSGYLRNDCWFGVAESYFPFHIQDIGPKTVCLSDEKISQNICVHHLAQALGVFLGIEYLETFCPQMSPIDKLSCLSVKPDEILITETDQYLTDQYPN
jgi:hypothetical protein